MGTRRKGRILAFQVLYSYEFSSGTNATPAGKTITNETFEELLDFSWLDDIKKESETFYQEATAFARLIVVGTIQNLEKIDSVIKNQLENWDFKRLSKVDLAILRMSVYCLCYQLDIPQTVTIDEAVDIAKEYSTEESYRFINGVLDGIVKSTKSK